MTIAADTARKALEAFNRHDAEAFAALHTSNVTACDPQYEQPLKGRDAIKEDIQAFFDAFPDIQATLLNVIDGGDTLALEIEMRGTHRGPLIIPSGPIPATNRAMEMRGARLERIDKEGRITECNRYYDLAGMMAQLGLVDGA